HPANDWNNSLYAKSDCKVLLERNRNRLTKSGLNFLWCNTHFLNADSHCDIDNRIRIGETKTHRQREIQDNVSLVFHRTNHHFHCNSLDIFAFIKPTKFQNILTMKK